MAHHEEEKNNTKNARWYTMAACHLFGMEMYEVWTKPNHSKIKMWRGKYYYIDDKLDLGFVVATVATTTIWCIWLLVLSMVERACGGLGALLLLGFTVASTSFLWQFFISPIRAADLEEHWKRLGGRPC